jgi:chorismate mutase
MDVENWEVHVMTNYCRGIRGATVARDNNAQAILAATRELLETIVERNDLHKEDIGGVIFTATPDLDAAYPARAARGMGWQHVPLLCMQEMSVVGSLQRCIRVLIHWNTDKSPQAVKHVYLREARALRPDLIEK